MVFPAAPGGAGFASGGHATPGKAVSGVLCQRKAELVRLRSRGGKALDSKPSSNTAEPRIPRHCNRGHRGAHNLSRADPAICATSRHWAFWRMTFAAQRCRRIKGPLPQPPYFGPELCSAYAILFKFNKWPVPVIPSRLWPCRGINARRLVVPGKYALLELRSGKS